VHVPAVSAWKATPQPTHAVHPPRTMTVLWHTPLRQTSSVNTPPGSDAAVPHTCRDGRWFYNREAMEAKAAEGTFRAGWDRIAYDNNGKRSIKKMYGFFASGEQYFSNMGSYGTVPQSPVQDPRRNELFDRNDGVANWGFELITRNLPCKLYLDWECTFLATSHPDPTHLLLRPQLDKLREDLSIKCGVDSAEIYVWEGSRQKTAKEFKLSYHIIVVRAPSPRHADNSRRFRESRTNDAFASQQFLIIEAPLYQRLGESTTISGREWPPVHRCMHAGEGGGGEGRAGDRGSERARERE